MQVFNGVWLSPLRNGFCVVDVAQKLLPGVVIIKLCRHGHIAAQLNQGRKDVPPNPSPKAKVSPISSASAIL